MGILETLDGFALNPSHFQSLLSLISTQLGLTRSESGLYVNCTGVYELRQLELYSDVHLDSSEMLFYSALLRIENGRRRFVLTSVISQPRQPNPETPLHPDSRVVLHREDRFGRAVFESIKSQAKVL